MKKLNRKTSRSKGKSGSKRRLLKFLFALFLLLLAIPVSIFMYVYLEIPAPIPNKEALQNIENPEASIVYDANGERIGKFFIYERTSIGMGNVSPHVIHALIATEDARFYEHNGVDYRSLMRVFFKTILLGDESAGGGSTISQQLAKNLYPRGDYRFMSLAVNKIREMIIATRLESIYSKEEILNLYLNTVPFSDNVFGIEAASAHFFSKKSIDLQVHEAALLVGSLKGNSLYNPRTNPEAALKRRDIVMHLMFNEGYITGQDLEIYTHKPISLKLTTVKQQRFAEYFLDRISIEAKKILSAQHTEESEYNLYTDGLRIYTTLDKTMQRYAESALKRNMKKLQGDFNSHWKSRKPWDKNELILKRAVMATPQYKALKQEGVPESEIRSKLAEKRKMEVFTWNGPKEVEFSTLDSVKHYLMILHAGLLAVDPHTGYVKAWVGGINHQFFKYDHVNIHTKRQVGSTFKPFVYATALEEGISPCQYYKASQETFVENTREWKPSNADDSYEGKYSMEGALQNSVNTISVKILEDVGVEKVIDNCKALGIESHIPPYPSIALGTPSISLFEMAGAYSVFANGGKVVEPVFLLKIEDRQGNVLWEAEENEPQKVLSKETAMVMVEMMKGVVNEGTAVRLRKRYGLTNDFAGKTGTTQNNADGWFMGYLPDLVVGVWVGADNPAIHFRTTALGQGANTALPIFAGFFRDLNKDADYNYITRERFAPLPEDLREKLDCDPFKEEFNFFEFLFGKKKDNKDQEGQIKENGESKPGFFKRIGRIFKKKD